ncbi:hypothetical protein [Amycolatopsis taiwanensis]|uniref:Uncharacterized protein n=1 Tax=Amycolatopsis taiwanensis TaxID=342230 RepID=A0A9W6R273_9PSEU|nr:hypothetical protein [Amycolatopsis taiwanensis]GLY66237.1 hypothetical protein Atai01_28560 [Amycolatopsis taiwanensis]
MDFHVNPDAVKQYAEVLDGLNSAIDSISEYMHTYGCDKSGFTGLFIVLQPVVDLVGSLYGDTLKFGKQRLASLVDGVNHTAETYEQTEGKVGDVLKNLLSEIDSAATSALA